GENFGDFLIAPFSNEGASSKTGAVHSRSLSLVSAAIVSRMMWTASRKLLSSDEAAFTHPGMFVRRLDIDR
ncbi:hypothetical protein ABUK24_21980, partial [Xanthomonas citri pv. mangiferaeindicae]|uniref:hypothetical protein n=1 Tax=Xanthomonas citri TaxID=346 RepID=UPI003F7D6B5A